MIDEQLKNIKDVLSSNLTGHNGEPNPEKGSELYILKSMWVMLCAEFEGCLKEIVKTHISQISKIENLNLIHPCLLVKGSYGEANLNAVNLVEIFKNGKNPISLEKILTKNTSIYKKYPVSNLFNSLGIFFSDEELLTMKTLDGVGKTRDSIAHGDREISITRKELEGNIEKIGKIYFLLKSKLNLGHHNIIN